MTVYTNAQGADANVQLSVEGDTWTAVEVMPQQASFGRLAADSTGEELLIRKLTIVNNLDTPANITDVRATSPSFKADVSTLEAGKKFELTVTMIPPLPPGNTYGTIEMNTGVAESPTLSVPVRAYVTADVDVMPASLTLRTEQQVAAKRQLFVRNNTPNPIKISDLAVSNPALTVLLEETKPGMNYRLLVDVPADYKVPPSGDKITFKTSSPRTPEVTVPITAISVPTPVASPKAGAAAPGAPIAGRAAPAPAMMKPAGVGAVKPAEPAPAKPPAQEVKPAGAAPAQPPAARETSSENKPAVAAQPSPAQPVK